MSEMTRTLDLLDRAYKEEAWHGPSLSETLAGVNAKLAAKRPLKGAHTIWEIVDHVASWNEIVALRLAGEKPHVSPGWNFPPMPKRATPAAWKASLRRLGRAEAQFRAAVAAFPGRKIGRRRPGTTSTWNVLIHGQIQHQLYHAGQIAMLRRGLGKPIG